MKIIFGFCIAIFVLILSLSASPAASESDKGSNEKKADTTYKVRVEEKEVKNRTVEGKVRNHTLSIDQPKEFGADDTAPTPPETLAYALGSCFVSAGRLIAIQRNMDIRAIGVVVESELDFSNALGMSQEKRAGFAGFKITAEIDAEMSLEDKKEFIQEISLRCPMCDNLQNPTPISYELKE
jgi:uncharacterized OsmC-like protein